MNPSRARVLVPPTRLPPTTTVYWTFRDLRCEDNWALIHARALKSPRLAVLYVLVPDYEKYTKRHYHFLVKSLRELDAQYKKRNVPFAVVEAKDVARAVAEFARDCDASNVVCDMTPTRTPMGWVREAAVRLREIGVGLTQVDAHNVVPVWKASPKLEYAARTIRPKIHNLLKEFLDDFVEFEPMPKENLVLNKNVQAYPFLHHANLDENMTTTDWDKLETICTSLATSNAAVGPVDEFYPPGHVAAHHALEAFLNRNRLGKQSTLRNDPNSPQVGSGLSPYMNFGLLAPQRVALRASAWDDASKHRKDVDTFLEELIIRRELSDNFCFYNPENYDKLAGGYEWAVTTLRQHASDKREYVYTFEQFENSLTHDDLWNAAQTQLRVEGKMHGFMRMYWAKKILEWTSNPDQALDFALTLNDKWALDGNDNPNGFVGIMWSIVGIHDQGWGERAVFGKIRFMNYEGCKRKFDVSKFVNKYVGRGKAAAAVAGFGQLFKKVKRNV